MEFLQPLVISMSLLAKNVPLRPTDIRSQSRRSLTDFRVVFTTGLNSRRTVKLLSYFPSHFKHVATLRNTKYQT